MIHPTQAQVDALTDAVAALVARHEAQRWPRWLSIDLAAQYTSLSGKSIRRLIDGGQLSPSRAVRGKVLIDRQQLDAVLVASCGRQLRGGRGNG